jgi:hypothetical protein
MRKSSGLLAVEELQYIIGGVDPVRSIRTRTGGPSLPVAEFERSSKVASVAVLLQLDCL